MKVVEIKKPKVASKLAKLAGALGIGGCRKKYLPHDAARHEAGDARALYGDRFTGFEKEPSAALRVEQGAHIAFESVRNSLNVSHLVEKGDILSPFHLWPARKTSAGGLFRACLSPFVVEGDRRSSGVDLTIPSHNCDVGR